MVDRGADDLMRRITLLGAVEREPVAIVSPAATPLGSVQDIVARAADDAEAVPFGTPPPGSPPHLAALRLQVLAGTRLNIVAFPSAAAARQAAVSGNVAGAALGLSNAVGDLREGRLVGLGLAATNRAEAFPDMPLLRELRAGSVRSDPPWFGGSGWVPEVLVRSGSICFAGGGGGPGVP